MRRRPKKNIAIRVSDVLYSGSGDTGLKTNVIDNLGAGRVHGFIDLLSPNGHMRRLQSGNETLPLDRNRWLDTLADFVTVRPRLDANAISGTQKGEYDPSHWLTCRQCRRKEKGPIAPTAFYRASKLTTQWAGAIILETSHTGGYTTPDDPKLDPIRESHPIIDKEWRNASDHLRSLYRFPKASKRGPEHPITESGGRG